MNSWKLEGIPVTITRKPVRTLRIVVEGTDGSVRVTAPKGASQGSIQSFLMEKLDWIKTCREKIFRRILPHPVDYISGETLYIQGEPYRLRVLLTKGRQYCERDVGDELKLYVRDKASVEKRVKILKEWYRRELKNQVQLLIAKWEPRLGVTVKEFGIKQMKTRWGTCNTRDQRIWVNLELAKRYPAYLEYIVIHEMVHLLEPTHNNRFQALMDQFCPEWRRIRKELNDGK